MSFTYEIVSGKLFEDSGALIAIGYSGDPAHKNDPQAVQLHNQGPIPPGTYTINPPTDTLTHGPFVLPLVPGEWNEMYGRAGFLVHGDSVVHPGTASEGCIILPRTIREQVWASGDRALDVVPTLPEDYFEGA